MTSRLTIVTGTARQDNHSQQVAQALYGTASGCDVTATLTSVKDHIQKAETIPPWGSGGADTVPTTWKQLVADTDTFIFVLPEYNHSYPGEWKILMDSLYAEYAGKKVYIAAVGGGQFAGARVMEHVLPVLVNFKFVIGNERLHVTADAGNFAADGSITDQALANRITTFVQAVVAGQGV